MEQRQNERAYRLAKVETHQDYDQDLKQWQTSLGGLKGNQTETSTLLFIGALNKTERLQIHGGLAKTESSLATQIRTEQKIGPGSFFSTGNALPTATSPACPVRGDIDKT